MFRFLKPDPQKKLITAYRRKLEEARDLQRAGDVSAAARVTAEAEEIGREIDRLGAAPDRDEGVASAARSRPNTPS